MNVRCPSCETLYRVDPAKVPDEGVRASCVTCGSVFLVTQRTSDEVPAPALPDVAEATTPSDLGQPPVPAAEAEISELAVAEPPEAPAVTIGEAAASVDTGLSDVAPDMPAVAESPGYEPVSQVPAPPVEIDAAWTAIEPTPPTQPVEPEAEPLHTADWPEADQAETTPASLQPLEQPKVAHFELETPAQTPVSEPVAPAEPADMPKPRFSRPFIQPRDSVAEPESPPAVPMRPSAPVFRPTPGMPVRTPPIPDGPPKPASPVAPIAPDIRPSARIETPAATPKRPVNPFLSRDPNQKARRLARALISDMIVYQPKKRQDALEAGTLKEGFDEEIKRSWEEYVQQVGEELANSTDFFTEALNDILAGGRQVF